MIDNDGDVKDCCIGGIASIEMSWEEGWGLEFGDDVQM